MLRLLSKNALYTKVLAQSNKLSSNGNPSIRRSKFTKWFPRNNANNHSNRFIYDINLNNNINNINNSRMNNGMNNGMNNNGNINVIMKKFNNDMQ